MTEIWTIEEHRRWLETGIEPESRLRDSQSRNETAGMGVNPSLATAVTKQQKKNEKELQTQCEQWLMHRGYRRLTAENAEKMEYATQGWFGHLVEAKRNPLMPDLFIFDLMMKRCLMVELKVVTRYQPGQLEMINAGIWRECRTFAGFVEIVKEWEGV